MNLNRRLLNDVPDHRDRTKEPRAGAKVVPATVDRGVDIIAATREEILARTNRAVEQIRTKQ